MSRVSDLENKVAAHGFFDIVQDINHMSDIYIIDKTK